MRTVKQSLVLTAICAVLGIWTAASAGQEVETDTEFYLTSYQQRGAMDEFVFEGDFYRPTDPNVHKVWFFFTVDYVWTHLQIPGVPPPGQPIFAPKELFNTGNMVAEHVPAKFRFYFGTPIIVPELFDLFPGWILKCADPPDYVGQAKAYTVGLYMTTHRYIGDDPETGLPIYEVKTRQLEEWVKDPQPIND